MYILTMSKSEVEDELTDQDILMDTDESEVKEMMNNEEILNKKILS